MVVAAPTFPSIKVDGSDLAAEGMARLQSVSVADRLTSPDMFALHFADPDGNVLASAGLGVGSAIEIATTGRLSDEPVTLISGEVCSIECEFDGLGFNSVARGYDRSHRLAAGRKTATYQGVTYADIARQLAQAAGLQADVDDTQGVHDHVFQTNQSDLDFLYQIARLANREFRVDGTSLRFKAAAESSAGPDEGDPESTTPTQLVCGAGLVAFRARMSAVGQVARVQVRGWDPQARQGIVGEADAVATNARLTTDVASLASSVGGQTMVVVNHGVTDQEAANRLAQARAEQIGSAAFEASGIAIGDPALRAGVAVSVAGAEPSLSGQWVISGSRHEFERGTYRTHLEFSGRQDRSLFGLVNQGSGGGGGAERHPGVVVAIVDDNADPQELGRVRLSYPWMGDEAVSFWARIAAPGAGNQTGVTWIPQVGDEVLVAFEHGDANHPVVIGGLWNGSDVVPFDYSTGLDAGRVTYCGFTSRSGHKISFHESSSESTIHLVTASGKASVVLDDMNEQVKVETTGKLLIDAQQDVEIKAGGSMKLEANGQVTIKGATVALN